MPGQGNRNSSSFNHTCHAPIQGLHVQGRRDNVAGRAVHLQLLLDILASCHDDCCSSGSGSGRSGCCHCRNGGTAGLRSNIFLELFQHGIYLLGA